jgi:CDP-glycerol glycerophosphotransferase (TagB/SpsB family)
MDSFIYKYYYSYFARAIIVGNYFMQRRRKEQYYLYLAHGAAFKAISDHRYALPKDCYGCDYSVCSDFMSKYDFKMLSVRPDNANKVVLGYPRNDELFNTSINLESIFNCKQSKYIYWLPTFRQKTSSKSDTKEYTSISVPFIHNEEMAQRINDCAKKHNALLIMKPHPAQDLSFVEDFKLSNIVFIDNSFLNEHDITNYQLLGASDALLTDYSSVYYDYLLCDKPIGLCWEDFEEYRQNEGFILDPEVIMAGGEKLYTPDDLCAFIERISRGEDKLNRQRSEIKDKVHTYKDNRSAERTVEHILKKIDRK